MSQRASGYRRLKDDRYFTPAWCTQALRPHLREVKKIWEPAAGNRSMSDVLKTWDGVDVNFSDKRSGVDFLKVDFTDADAIVTNPPYKLAEEFIVHAIDLMSGVGGRVAMLLRVDYDSARSRQYLFGRFHAFSKKIVLTSRIRWFPDSTGAPSFNHAWYIWDLGSWDPDGARIVYHEKDPLK